MYRDIRHSIKKQLISAPHTDTLQWREAYAMTVFMKRLVSLCSSRGRDVSNPEE